MTFDGIGPVRPGPTAPPAAGTVDEVLANAHRLRKEFHWSQQDVDAYVREQTGLPSMVALATQIASQPDLSPGAAPGLFPSTVVGFGRGASFNFLDRLAGAAEIQSSPMENPAVAYLRGRDASRAYQGEAAAAHPLATTIANLAGMLTSGLATGGAAPAVSLPMAALRGGLTAAAMTGASALGAEPDLTQPGAYKRAGVQAAIALPFGAVAGVGAQALSNRLLGKAAQALQTGVDRSGGVPALSLAQSAARAAGRGASTVPADLSPALQELGDVAATNATPETRAAYAAALAARRSGQPQRLAEDLRDIYGRALDAPARQAELKALVRQIERDPQIGYQALNQPIQDDRLADFLNRPIVAGAYRASLSDLAAAGHSGAPFEEGLTPPAPTFQTLNATRITLRDMANSAFRAGRTARGAALKEASQQLRDILAANVPPFEDLQAQVAGLKGKIDASVLAERVLTNETPMGLARKMQNLSPDQLDEFRLGLASKLYERLASARTGKGVASTLLEDPGLQQKLETAFGDQGKFADFMNRAAQENIQSRTAAAFGGSQTAARLNARELFGGQAVHGGVALTPRGAHPYIFSPLFKGNPTLTGEPLARALFTPQSLDEFLATIAKLRGRGGIARSAAHTLPGLFSSILHPQGQ